MQVKRLDNSSTITKYRFTLDEGETIDIQKAVNEVEPYNFGHSIKTTGNNYFDVAIYID